MTLPRQATIKDVARRAGVSYSTVSRALNNSPLVNAATKAKVLEVAQRLNYSPNPHAQGLARGQSKMLGIVVPDLRGTLLMEVAEAAERTLDKAGFRALLCHSEWNFEVEAAHVDFLRASRVGGAILCPIGVKEEPAWLKRLAREGFPVVLVDRFFPQIEISHVVTDNALGGRLAAQHLLQRGHRQMLCFTVSEAEELSSTRDRLAGFRAAVREAGCPASAVKTVRFHLMRERDQGFPTLHRALDAMPRHQAVFCINDVFAMVLYQTMMARGLTLRDLDLVGFDDARVVPFLELPWSSVAQPKAEMGRRAAEILLEMLEKGPDHVVRESLPPRLVVR